MGLNWGAPRHCHRPEGWVLHGLLICFKDFEIVWRIRTGRTEWWNGEIFKGSNHLLKMTLLLQPLPVQLEPESRWLAACPVVGSPNVDCDGGASTKSGRTPLSRHSFLKHHDDQMLPHSASRGKSAGPPLQRARVCARSWPRKPSRGPMHGLWSRATAPPEGSPGVRAGMSRTRGFGCVPCSNFNWRVVLFHV